MTHLLADRFVYLILFLLPLQTRWIFSQELLNGNAWEYGTLSLYGVEILILIAMLLRRRVAFFSKALRPARYGMWFLAALVASFALSVSYVLSAVALMHVALALVLFLLLLDRRLSTKNCVVAFLFGLIPVCALGWFQALTGTSPASSWFGLAEHVAATPGASVIETASERVLRAYGTFPHPNVFGGYLAVAAIVLAWLVKEGKGRSVLWQAVLTAVVLSTLVVTFSRSAWLAVLSAFVVVVFFSLWFHRTLPRRTLAFVLVGLVSVTATVAVFSEPIFTRFDPSARLEAKSLAERQGEYAFVDDVIFKNPVSGVGVGAYTLALSEVRPGQEVWAYQPVHNAFALIFAEAGLLGFLAFVCWFTSIDRVSYKVARTTNGMLGLGLGTALLVLALFDHYLWSLPCGLWLAAFAFAMILRWSEEAK